MRRLAMRVAKGLETSDFQAAHEPELSRIWPDKGNRDEAIRQFAARYGWQVKFYKDGTSVVFEKQSSAPQDNL
jgi:hypothetical protein